MMKSLFVALALSSAVLATASAGPLGAHSKAVRTSESSTAGKLVNGHPVPPPRDIVKTDPDWHVRHNDLVNQMPGHPLVHQ